MKCDDAGKLIPLYYYGELAPGDEEQLEDHLHSCLECARESEQQRTLAAALDRRQTAVDPELLNDCRRDLLVALYRDKAQAHRKQTVWQGLADAFSTAFAGLVRFRQPAGAVALVAVGFLAARFTGTSPVPSAFTPPPSSDQVFSTVRAVQPDAQGRVRITFDETRRRSVAGNVDDDNIRRLLLTAARDDNNPAVRVESVDLLKAAPGSDEIRGVLLNAVAHDPNAGVRLRALDGLKEMAKDAKVRSTLAQVLVSDDNPAVRMQAIDLLVQHRDESIVGVLQNVVQKDNNSYVRLKCEKALKEMNASVGTF